MLLMHIVNVSYKIRIFLMSWETYCTSDSIEYVLQNNAQDEIYTTGSITLNNTKMQKEPSGGYQEPDDDVRTDTYIASSDHGYFKWIVISRRSGFESFANIEDVQCIEPSGCDILDNPNFVVR